MDVLYIVDARPKVNAVANQAMGKGFESEKLYRGTRLVFANVANIHVMRDSRKDLAEVGTCKDSHVSRTVANSQWLEHIRRILVSGIEIASLVHVEESPVLVHCSDGWDRTAQLTSIAMLLLDPFYRTIRGFEILIEKEWLSFGHKFAERMGHQPKRMANAGDGERSPVFLQFIDCVWQLMQVAPVAFEWNADFLTDLMDAVHRCCVCGVFFFLHQKFSHYSSSCHFGTFLFDSEKEREDAQLHQRTESFWTWVNKRQEESKVYSNIFYDPVRERPVFLPDITSVQLWPYYIRYRERKLKDRKRPVIAPRTLEDVWREMKKG